MRVVVLGIIAALLCSRAQGFAEWMTTDFCSQPLAVGEVIMNEEVQYSQDKHVVVHPKDDPDVVVANGSVYAAAKRYSVDIVGLRPGEQAVVEVSLGATLVGGGCDGRRLANQRKVELVVDAAPPPNAIIHLVVAWAAGHATVFLTPPFLLVPNNNNNNNSISSNDNNATSTQLEAVPGAAEAAAAALAPKDVLQTLQHYVANFSLSANSSSYVSWLHNVTQQAMRADHWALTAARLHLSANATLFAERRKNQHSAGSTAGKKTFLRRGAGKSLTMREREQHVLDEEEGEEGEEEEDAQRPEKSEGEEHREVGERLPLRDLRRRPGRPRRGQRSAFGQRKPSRIHQLLYLLGLLSCGVIMFLVIDWLMKNRFKFFRYLRQARGLRTSDE